MEISSGDMGVEKSTGIFLASAAQGKYIPTVRLTLTSPDYPCRAQTNRFHDPHKLLLHQRCHEYLY